MDGVKECFVAALVQSDGRVELFDGLVRGEIGYAPRGEQGFYDPIFVIAGDGRTMAELQRARSTRSRIEGCGRQAARASCRGATLAREAPVPNNYLITESGLGHIAPDNDDVAMVEMIDAATHRSWDRRGAQGYVLAHHTGEHRSRVYERILSAKFGV